MSLTTLPAELRVMIFEYLLISPSGRTHNLRTVKGSSHRTWLPPSNVSKVRDNPTLCPSILLACRLFHEEGRKMLYSQNSFLISWPVAFQTAQPLLRDDQSCITKLVFQDSSIARSFITNANKVGSFPALQSVTFIITGFETLIAMQHLQGHGLHPVTAHTAVWRLMITKFRQQYPSLKRFECQFEQHQCPIPHEPPMSDAVLPDQILRAISCSQQSHEFRFKGYADWLDMNNDQETDAEWSYSTHPRAKYHLPLNFDHHRTRMQKIREWLGNEKEDFKFRFETETSWEHVPRILIKMIAVQKPSTTIPCQVSGVWGRMSRVEELDDLAQEV
ncbi:hypothetical protein BT63DRAFT_428621 [Microthyrium microscopicum]|uniref:F-box domain-containing protein n=1 Tax=Microthyrium microscopicum TaxID=703497 RepID=A0A6A6U006_9PEZI|nr:hypothetical protein BT63DRAFT_428621 [Microthyrium microscopicum]